MAMDKNTELAQERAYTMRVQQILSAVLMSIEDRVTFKEDSIRMILADAWDELRMKPTALSPQELDQLTIEVDRFMAQRNMAINRGASYRKMLSNPFFARIDFEEPGEPPEKIVIGLYSLRDPGGDILVHDWRAPICSLYYDAIPGEVSFNSPSGPISGQMTLKRQYCIEGGQLKYFVDTDYSVNDSMLLDVLAGSTSAHMRQIVSSIQSEQNRVIRSDQARVMSVTGGAGSGKTSVAMHRAAYLLYHHRDALTAKSICVLSPTNAFIEYISSVLPDLGEENTQAMTLTAVIERVLGKKIEKPVQQYEALIQSGGALRRRSVSWKAGPQIIEALDAAVERLTYQGPAFEDIIMDGRILFKADRMRQMYGEDMKLLSAAQRLQRIRLMIESRLEDIEKALYPVYEKQMIDSYKRQELVFATKLAIAQKLRPIRAQIKSMLSFDPALLYAEALRDAGAPEELITAAEENAQAGLIWHEDAAPMAYLRLRLGSCRPDDQILTLLVDEAQDYTDIALKLMQIYFPKASVTLLGDPNQRTLPGLPPCDPARWGSLFGEDDAPCMHLTRGYRSTLEIAAYCASFLDDDAQAGEPIGRHGPAPTHEAYHIDALRSRVGDWLNTGMKRVAIVTASQREATRLADQIKGSFLLTGDINELEDKGVTIGCINLMKGLEFDAVAVVWDMSGAAAQDERRRLYTACSRALHELAIFDLSDGHQENKHA